MSGTPGDTRMATEGLERAMELLVARDWQAAHEIVQKDKSTLAAWLHGIVHTIEGDLDNARYWYRRAKRAFPGSEAVEHEVAEARRAVDTQASTGQEKA